MSNSFKEWRVNHHTGTCQERLPHRRLWQTVHSFWRPHLWFFLPFFNFSHEMPTIPENTVWNSKVGKLWRPSMDQGNESYQDNIPQGKSWQLLGCHSKRSSFSKWCLGNIKPSWQLVGGCTGLVLDHYVDWKLHRQHLHKPIKLENDSL